MKEFWKFFKKTFAELEISTTFAPAIRRKKLLIAVERFLEKFFWKKFPKDLEVSKMCFIFAPAFASKTADSEKGSQKNIFEKSFQNIW